MQPRSWSRQETDNLNSSSGEHSALSMFNRFTGQNCGTMAEALKWIEGNPEEAERFFEKLEEPADLGL